MIHLIAAMRRAMHRHDASSARRSEHTDTRPLRRDALRENPEATRPREQHESAPEPKPWWRRLFPMLPTTWLLAFELGIWLAAAVGGYALVEASVRTRLPRPVPSRVLLLVSGLVLMVGALARLAAAAVRIIEGPTT